MFEQLVNETAAALRLPNSSVSAVLRELLSLMSNERTGGVEGFIGQLRRAGVDVFTSGAGGPEVTVIGPGQLEAALGIASLDTMARASALTRPAVTAALGLLVPTVLRALTKNGKHSASRPHSLSQPGLVLAAPNAPNAQPLPGAPVPPANDRDAAGWLPWAIGAFIVALLGLWLQRAPATVDPQLTLSNRDGQVTYAGLVPDPATANTIGQVLAETFGEGNLRGGLRVDANVKRASWMPRIGELVRALNVPGVDVGLTGDTVSLGGWLSQADRRALTDTLKGILGPAAAFQLTADPAIDAVRFANASARAALDALGTADLSTGAIVQAMNMAIINFASDSAEIPAEAHEVIQFSAEALRRVPANARIEVGGHTDNTGSAAANLTLSQARAEAVRAALVNAGAPAALLQARGYGDTRPSATNDTEYGRFRNRRIEYGIIR